MTEEGCKAMCPDFRVVRKKLEGGLRQVGAEWTNAKGVTCAACVHLKPEHTPKQEASFVKQLIAHCHKMMVEDAA